MTAACETHGTACTPDRPVTIPGPDECGGPWGTQCPWPEGHDSALDAAATPSADRYTRNAYTLDQVYVDDERTGPADRRVARDPDRVKLGLRTGEAIGGRRGTDWGVPPAGRRSTDKDTP